MYVAHIVEVFREVHRVLRNDGTLWLNLGDCYITKPIGAGSTFDPKWPKARDRKEGLRANRTNSPGSLGLKHKDQAGIPWRVYFALQDDGWYARRDIVWFKPNSMPESIEDRPGTSHEYLFLLSKKPKYFYDRLAIIEPVAGTAHGRGSGVNPKAKLAGRNSRAFVLRDPQHVGRRASQNPSFSAAVTNVMTYRNKRSVWSIATAPYREAHFATFPPRLVEPCLLAGTSEYGCCATCGAPWVRVIKRKFYGDWSANAILKAQGVNRQYRNGKWTNPQAMPAEARWDFPQAQKMGVSTARARKAGGAHDNPFEPPRTLGWRPSCKCYDPLYRMMPQARRSRKRCQREAAGTWWKRARARPGLPIWPFDPAKVLDPFGGSGTVGAVAKRFGRDAILVEINHEYVELAQKRIALAKLHHPTAIIEPEPLPAVPEQGILPFAQGELKRCPPKD